jgi:signal transduction histidine kinase
LSKGDAEGAGDRPQHALSTTCPEATGARHGSDFGQKPGGNRANIPRIQWRRSPWQNATAFSQSAAGTVRTDRLGCDLLRAWVSIAVVLLALSAIVGLSMSSATVEEERLLAAFTVETRQQVHASAEALARLDSVHQDMQMLADLVERSRNDHQLDAATERRVWQSAFRALAVVVPQHRIIALVDPEGALDVLAVDPTEKPATPETLLPSVKRLGIEAARAGAETLGKPVRLGARSFLVYATPVPSGGAIVVASEAAQLLRSVAWPQIQDSRLFVTDPSAVVWSGCETAAGCRVTEADVVPKVSITDAPLHLDARQAQRLGLFPATALGLSEKVVGPTGAWTVTWIASSEPIKKREQSVLSRIITTAIAAAVVVAAVGTVLLRQQRRAAGLTNQLRYAEAKAQARDLENQLVRADRLITVGVMATEIAHEVGTPLAVVRGRAEQVIRQVGAGRGGDDLRVIIKHVDQISATIRQLLDFSRRSAFDQRSIALAVIVERTRELLLLKLEARRLQLEVHLNDDLPMLTADPDQLQQVLVNLLINACDASPPGGQVSLSARRAPSDMVQIEVLDRGCGISPEHLAAVFEPFFTTKPRGEGTGLGLSITAGIVRNHAGQIDLRSAPGAGTTVTVLWPASPPGGGAHV